MSIKKEFLSQLLLFLFFMLLVVFSTLFIFRAKSKNAIVNDKAINVELKNYPKTLDSIKIIKTKLETKSTKEIGETFTNILTNKIFPYWYGTKWDYNGTTQKPNEGEIACGYFVTTTLRDTGLNINRIKLAQCASEEMIQSIVSEKNIFRFSNKSIQEFENILKSKGNGIYIVGLDNHTGFVLISNNSNFFIHSSGISPYKVIKEKLLESRLIVNSKYRVVGKLSSDKKMLNNWIKN
jgi:preprotein translocase subunit Sss1